MKVHLAKMISGNQVTLSRSECGKQKYSSKHQSLMIVKRRLFGESETQCINCLKIAKDQNRI